MQFRPLGCLVEGIVDPAELNDRPIDNHEVLFPAIHNPQAQRHLVNDKVFPLKPLLDIFGPADPHSPYPVPLIPRPPKPIVHGRPHLIAEHPEIIEILTEPISRVVLVPAFLHIAV